MPTDVCHAPAGNPATTVAPITAPSASGAHPAVRPEFLRLPPSGGRCPHTGMSRSALNALVLPTEQNRFKPPVKSFVLRQRGAKKGIRLIAYDDLAAYIRAHLETGITETQADSAKPTKEGSAAK